MLRRRIGEFYIVEHIGAGGMADVYVALNPRTNEKRAIKILKKRALAGASCYARFLREVELIRGLSHPNIVAILESGVLDDCYYYSMEYMLAGSLARRVSRGRMPLPDIMETFASICQGMAYAHDRGIIHRDLKPANILIGMRGEPKISDFGIAKNLAGQDPSLTRSNEIMGSIAYLSPEQRSSTKAVDRRADVYSLGAVLYEMVMGFPPLGRFPLPMELQPDFPERVQAIITKCLAQNPDLRYDDAGQLLEQVERLPKRSKKKAAGSPAHSPKPPAPEPGKPGVDRIEEWLKILREGTTRERLSVIRHMVDTMDSREARAVMRVYPTEGDRVRWGLIRVFGERRVPGSTPLILSELHNSFQRECALEALGKIAAEEAFEPIRDLLSTTPSIALNALLPLARTGRQRAVSAVAPFLAHPMAVLREAAVKALACIGTDECLGLLKGHIGAECDERVRTAIRECVREITVHPREADRMECKVP